MSGLRGAIYEVIKEAVYVLTDTWSVTNAYKY